MIVGFLALWSPVYNWDVIPYIACARSLETADVNDIHSFTYRMVQAGVPEPDRAKLLGLDGSNYKKIMTKDPRAFNQQLFFYRIRIIYIAFIYLLHKTGVNIVFSTFIISAVSVILGLWIIFHLCYGRIAVAFVYALPLLCLFFGVLDVARLSTPDGIAFLGVILSAYLYVSNKPNTILIFLPWLVAVRTDLILFVLPLLGFMLIYQPNYRLRVLISLICSVAAYSVLNRYFQYPGWKTLFYFQFIERLAFPAAAATTSISWSQYLKIFCVNGLGDMILFNKEFVLFLIFAWIGIYYVAIRRNIDYRADNRSVSLFACCLIYILVHFVLFPAAWNRFFLGQYVAGSIVLLSLMTDAVPGEELQSAGANVNAAAGAT
jgi:hypothetical protein